MAIEIRNNGLTETLRKQYTTHGIVGLDDARGLYMVEAGSIDIELNALPVVPRKYWNSAEANDMTWPVQWAYFVCTHRDGEQYWDEAGYADDILKHGAECTVDFTAPDWEDKLQREMLDVLRRVRMKYICNGQIKY